MLRRTFQTEFLEAGCDEAGRGCLAGPVVAAAVILPLEFESYILNDSKKLSEKYRNELRIKIEEEAVCYGIGFVFPDEIDKMNILNASILAMHKALNQLRLTPDFIAVDGNRFKPYKKIKHQCIIKGDAKYMNIAAASILAKTYRDEYMQKIHDEFPYYEWNRNKGYPTFAHRSGIRKFGSCKYHRNSFNLLIPQLKLEFD